MDELPDKVKARILAELKSTVPEIKPPRGELKLMARLAHNIDLEVDWIEANDPGYRAAILVLSHLSQAMKKTIREEFKQWIC
jgi:hypothetical protein